MLTMYVKRNGATTIVFDLNVCGIHCCPTKHYMIYKPNNIIFFTNIHHVTRGGNSGLGGFIHGGIQQLLMSKI